MYEQYDQKNEWVKNEQTNWENLADLRCPKCNLGLIFKSQFDRKYFCSCGFEIHQDRYNQIITEMRDRRLNSVHRKALQEGRKIKFKETKTFKGNKAERLNLGF